MTAVEYYRMYLPLREVNRSTEINAKVMSQSEIGEQWRDGEWSDDFLAGRDIYMHGRNVHENCDAYLDRLHEMGALMVMDCDDDLTETWRLVSGRGEEFKYTLSRVDYVTASTAPLARLFGRYTRRPVTVLQNHVDVEWMQSLRSDRFGIIPEGVTVGFSGSPTHQHDWAIASTALSLIADSVVPMVHGDPPGYFTYVDGIVCLGYSPFSVYPAMLSQFDILLCAVDTNDHFNDGKSSLKALEAMAVGAVPICSRFGPYMDLAETGAPLVIVEEDTQDGWFEAIRDLVEDEEKRTVLYQNGPSWVRDNRDMMESGYELWADFYRSII